MDVMKLSFMEVGEDSVDEEGEKPYVVLKCGFIQCYDL